MDSALIATTLTLTSTSTGLFPTGYFHSIEQLLLHVYYVCLIYRAHVPHPLCVYSISQTDGILRKLCVLDAITMKRLLGGHSARFSRFQPLLKHMWIYITLVWSEACFAHYYGGCCFWILRSMSMIFSKNMAIYCCCLLIIDWLKKCAHVHSVFLFNLSIEFRKQLFRCFLRCR